MLYIQPWFWLVLGLILIALETLGTAGFLLGVSIASFVMAIITFVFSTFDWRWQLISFSLLSLILTICYWNFFRSINNKTDHLHLNDRASQLIGRIVLLEQDLQSGEDKIKVGDTLWKVRSENEIEAGVRVIIYASDGMTLSVKRYK